MQKADLDEVGINLARELSFGEDIGKLRVTEIPMKLVNTDLLTLTNEVESAFVVASFAGKFTVLCNLNRGFVVNHEDGGSSWKSLRRSIVWYQGRACRTGACVCGLRP